MEISHFFQGNSYEKFQVLPLISMKFWIIYRVIQNWFVDPTGWLYDTHTLVYRVWLMLWIAPHSKWETWMLRNWRVKFAHYRWLPLKHSWYCNLLDTWKKNHYLCKGQKIWEIIFCWLHFFQNTSKKLL